MQTIDPLIVVGVFAGLAVLIIVIYLVLYASPFSSASCPKEIHRKRDGTLVLHPSGRTFPDMNGFQQWWNSSGLLQTCPLPILTGAREMEVIVSPDRPMRGPEETWAKTPINKVDDYEFSRVFGIERGNEMVVPRQNFNKIVTARAFDPVNKPITSEDRKDSYRGLVEGFTATGDLTSDADARYGVSDDDSSREAAARYNETSSVGYPEAAARFGEVIEDESDKDCKISREEKKIAKMVSKAYANDPNFDPVVVKVGPNQWEVTELIPKRRGEEREVIVKEEILDPKRDTVEIEYKYPGEGGHDRKDMIDPFFPPRGSAEGGSWERHRDHDGKYREEKDPYYGYVPGLERPFGPTFDHFSWT
jgi:hypothetical protein